jgi:hypothetical protein
LPVSLCVRLSLPGTFAHPSLYVTFCFSPRCPATSYFYMLSDGSRPSDRICHVMSVAIFYAMTMLHLPLQLGSRRALCAATSTDSRCRSSTKHRPAGARTHDGLREFPDTVPEHFTVQPTVLAEDTPLWTHVRFTPLTGHKRRLSAVSQHCEIHSWNNGSFRTRTRDVRTYGATAPHLQVPATGSG